MEELPEELQQLIRERKLNAEDVIRQSNGNVRYTSLLQGAAVELAERLPPLSLTTSINYLTRCQQFSGVYMIYYVGETLLYGDLVSSSQVQPIYVGMSRTDILSRLKEHNRKVERAKDLVLEDFAVQFIIVDINHYASTIEEMLIEYYSPLWNHNKIVAFSFGNAGDENNNWKKYHVDQDKHTIKYMIKCVRRYNRDRQISA